MAHHGHFEHNLETQALRVMQDRPPSAAALPSISEDELNADNDEPPETRAQAFSKTITPGRTRAHSLLTKALHTEGAESHDEQTIIHATAQPCVRDASRSSTCSTASVISSNGFVSDGALTTSTRASTPSSPPAPVAVYATKPMIQLSTTTHARDVPASGPHVSPVSSNASEPSVEATLGRKRCITFACGRKQQPAVVASPEAVVVAEVKPATPPRQETKRPCALRFVCPLSKSSQKLSKERAPRAPAARHHSPAPAAVESSPAQPASPAPRHNRPHRDSDATFKNSSPRSVRKAAAAHLRQLSNESVTGQSEAMRFHEFATSEEEVEDWVQESTCYRSRLTLNDTLKKENVIRETCEEAEEEALEAEEEEAGAALDEFDDDDVSDDGFQTDDEDGFAESDDDSDAGSDYEWWTMGSANKRGSLIPYADSPGRRRSHHHAAADTYDDDSSASPSRSQSPAPRHHTLRKAPRATGPVQIRPGTPELPDSTDFVCGTLDEDRPLEQAYLACISQRKLAKQKPQDIDPTFPISDPEIESDDCDEDDDDDDVQRASVADSVHESDQYMLFHGRLDNIDGPHPRGRRASRDVRSTTPTASPRRGRSPAPLNKRPTFPHSPAPLSKRPTFPHSPAPLSKRPTFPHSPAPPRALFGHSPIRQRSPMPMKLNSPRNSLTGSPTASFDAGTVKAYGAHPFLGERPQLTHTASLPRSPNPFSRRARKMTPGPTVQRCSDDDGDSTAHETTYNRGAIDIVQGLEFKRLRRRRVFYERYCRKEEKKQQRKEKHSRRPQPGKGAQRMRKIGIECAEYRGKRVLSI